MAHKIDIILLTYDNVDDTDNCLDHLYSFTTEDFRLIVLDNNSTDGTVEYLKEFEKREDNVILHLSDKNFGCVSGRNFAYGLSGDSEYVCFLDNDQFVGGGWLEIYMEYIDKGFDIVGAEGWQMRSDFYPLRRTKEDETFSYVGCGGMVLKRKVIDDIGLFNDSFNPLYFEDPDFCWRANDAGYKICWDIYHAICHKPHKLLGIGDERKKQFIKSWGIFKKTWRGTSVPKLSNTIDK